jgi:hypothetical protein
MADHPLFELDDRKDQLLSAAAPAMSGESCVG